LDLDRGQILREPVQLPLLLAPVVPGGSVPGQVLEVAHRRAIASAGPPEAARQASESRPAGAEGSESSSSGTEVQKGLMPAPASAAIKPAYDQPSVARRIPKATRVQALSLCCLATP